MMNRDAIHMLWDEIPKGKVLVFSGGDILATLKPDGEHHTELMVCSSRIQGPRPVMSTCSHIKS